MEQSCMWRTLALEIQKMGLPSRINMIKIIQIIKNNVKLKIYFYPICVIIMKHLNFIHCKFGEFKILNKLPET